MDDRFFGQHFQDPKVATSSRGSVHHRERAYPIVSHINELVSATPKSPSLPVQRNINNTIRANPLSSNNLPATFPLATSSPPTPAIWVAEI